MQSELGREWTDGTSLMQDTQVANDNRPRLEPLPYGTTPTVHTPSLAFGV